MHALGLLFACTPEKPRLPQQVVRQLCIRAKQGSTEARTRLLQSHLALIVHVAKAFYRPGAFMELADLVQQGAIGLLHAVKKFDPKKRSRGRLVRFSTYAHYWVAHYIRREIENHGRTIAIPIQRLREHSREQEHSYRLPLTALTDEQAHLHHFVDQFDSPDLWCSRWASRVQVERLLGCLSENKRSVIHYRFGLDGLAQGRSKKEVQSITGLPAWEVGSLERSALKELQVIAHGSETP